MAVEISDSPAKVGKVNVKKSKRWSTLECVTVPHKIRERDRDASIDYK